MELKKDIELRFKKITQNAKAPFKGSSFAAGYDICSSENIQVPPKGKTLIGTGIVI